jgi:HSP20 family molecular chaperone IbpA
MASFQNGLLMLTLPKNPEAHRLEKKTEVTGQLRQG